MSLDKQQVAALDRLRTQLAVAARQLGSSRENLIRGDPLQPWESLQGDVHFIVKNIVAVQDTLEKHREFLTSLHAYPLPSFPGYSKEVLLQNVMRKKLDVAPEDWVAKYSKPRVQANRADGMEIDGADGELEDKDFPQLWREVAADSRTFAKDFVYRGTYRDAYTIEERETGVQNVVTGLKRNLGGKPHAMKPSERSGTLHAFFGFKTNKEEDNGVVDHELVVSDEDSDEETEDVPMGGVVPDSQPRAPPEPDVDASLPPLNMEKMLRFMTTGITMAEQDDEEKRKKAADEERRKR
ncbi:mediator of RNA polymerase II transcription subunit 8 [Elasticomyces elasticus]|uniref:Mediator of RNA polymerase II transcription subunit 8 n=1 Tax=Elasticomyces elasticus TaxID=574655 RepID=A0AAN8A3B8_9PEZI|nr:mediator of RNA polymerase II transcription subunit 8 [Elasticomyces elasticus]